VPEGRPASPDPQDAYARLQYRRFVAWGERIRREEPFLLGVFASGPERSLLDLGCGTGEHAIHFARAGFRVLGLDLSASLLEEAAKQAGGAPVRFVAGDMGRLREVVREHFGSAVCLGNTLVHLQEEHELRAACREVHEALLPGGSWVVQILNYARILDSGERHLPLNFRPDGDGELVFLRLVRPLADRRIQFIPTTLRVDPQADPPVEVKATHVVMLRAWMREDLQEALRAGGFTTLRWYGDMCGTAFDPATSGDLVCVATRAP
jgi:SAM-dependent methyltransferase